MQNCKSVHTLITIGSPLAMPQIISNKLQPQPKNGLLQRPAIRRWINIAHQHDWVAHPFNLQAHVDGPVENHMIEAGKHAHDVQNYLRCAQLAQAVADALQQPQETII